MKELQEMRLHFKRLSKIIFLKVGKGHARGGWVDREGVCDRRLCNCSDIFIENPPSLSCVLQRASLTPVDGESSRGAVFSIIPEAIVRAASERLTVASWDFTKTQQNTRRREWDRKRRGGGGVRVGKILRLETRKLVVAMKKKCRCVKYYITWNLKSNIVGIVLCCRGWHDGCMIRVVVICGEHAACTASKRQSIKCETRWTVPVGLYSGL